MRTILLIVGVLVLSVLTVEKDVELRQAQSQVSELQQALNKLTKADKELQESTVILQASYEKLLESDRGVYDRGYLAGACMANDTWQAAIRKLGLTTAPIPVCVKRRWKIQ
jgi:hypothetical protein